ncbi:restriction endonuclease subunit S [Psychrobacter sp. B38]|uniref:restriction endonuclease subunit S n=1 Tax=Psychrobacter sp. B38 TaxID=3143538 RepID=UPI00320C99D6
MAELVMKYRQYEGYKESGVEWLDVIPSHWVMSKIKYISPFQVGWTPPTGNDSNFIGENIWANISDLRGKIITDTVKRISDKAAEEASMDITPKGSLLYSFKLSVGSVSFAGCDMYTNEAIASFTSDSLLPLEYLYYVLPKFLIENASTNIYGARILNQELIRNAIILKPTYEEAETIANFLDHETAQIDTLIKKQQTLIQLLKEKRQAVISHAVTKGLNPNAPMKDLGVEWLGEVPEHWEVTKLGFHTSKIGSGKTPRGGAEVYQEEGVLFIRSQNVYDSGLRVDKSESVFVSEIIHEEMSNTKVQGGDILLNVTGGSIGRTCIVPNSFIEANVNQHVCIVRLPISMRYFIAFVLKSSLVKEQIDSIQTGGNREGLNFEQISKFIICLPPEEERADIVSYIERETKKIDSLLEQSNNAIQLMQERRTALISAAVTGKIDVRGWNG